MSPAAPLPFRLLAITPPGAAGDDGLDAAVAAAADAGGPQLAVLLRDPGAAPDALRRRAERLLPLCRARGARLLVHADPVLARELGADGVHLPERGPTPAEARERLGPGALVGASRHDADGLRRCAGADYATLSPIFATPGKGLALGLEGLRAAYAAAPLPVVALGGVTAGNAALCRDAGAAAVAAIRAVWAADAGGAVRALLGALENP